MAKAVIFDMDGVISETQTLQSKAESRIFAKLGIPITPEEIDVRFAGVPDKLQFSILLKEANVRGNPDDIFAQKWDLMKDLVAEKGIHEVPGAIQLVKELHSADVPLAIASAANLQFIRQVVGSLGIEHCFSALTSGDEVPNGKPAPDVFLLAAKRLGVEPKDCVVIEDGVAGMQGAKAAGMKCIGLVPKGTTCPADITIQSLKELSAELIKKF